MPATHVKDLMESRPVYIKPDGTLCEAASLMKKHDFGFLPVGKTDREIEGIITDRDIVIRALADKKDPAREKVGDYMSREVHTCAAEDTLDRAAEIMNTHNVSRLLVQDAQGRVRGVLTFGRIIRSNDNRDETAQVVDQAVGREAA